MHIERDSRRIVRRLEKEGWVLKSTRGSHAKYQRDGRVVVVPHPRKDLPLGTARAIARAVGWLEEE